MLTVAIGILLMSATVIFHIAGTVVWVYFGHQRRVVRQPLSLSSSMELRTIIHALFLTTVVILFLHVAEVILWAAAYYFLPDNARLGDFIDCVYFSMVTYTTLGYGDIVITDQQWRLLPGIQAMGGMLAFGWSSALLFAAVQQVVAIDKRS